MKKITLLFIATLLTGTMSQIQRINSFTIEGITALGPSAAFNPTETGPGDLQIVYPNAVDLSNVTAIYDETVLTSPLPTDFTQTQRVEVADGTTNVTEVSQTNAIYSVNGIFYIHSSENSVADIYGIDGTKIRTLQLTEGENGVYGLARGAYLIYNKIIIIK